ncbi:MAG: S-adenosylmethionine:tRNA ribosyltransferase-isomerase, partial [Limisphaerales bacterium]
MATTPGENDRLDCFDCRHNKAWKGFTVISRFLPFYTQGVNKNFAGRHLPVWLVDLSAEPHSRTASGIPAGRPGAERFAQAVPHWLSQPDTLKKAVRTADFHYDLPAGLIAQTPAPERDQSRLLVLHRHNERIEHGRFRDLLAHLRAGDVIVLNSSRVIPARLRAAKMTGGGPIEVLLLEENQTNDWWCLVRPGKRVRAHANICLMAGGPAAGR